MIWKCPKCNASWQKCGNGAKTSCKQSYADHCEGFLCECSDEGTKNHGTEKFPCPQAVCDHCGWEGVFPLDTKKCSKCKGSGAKAVVDGENKSVSLHSPGTEVTLNDGTSYIVAPDGLWRKVKG